MTHIKKLHLDTIKYEEQSCITQDGDCIKFVDSSAYYDVAYRSAQITEDIAVEFGEFCRQLSKNNKDILRQNPDITTRELFQEFLKTKP